MTRAARQVGAVVAALVVLAVLWETYKALGPANGASLDTTRLLPRTDDRAMPHLWTVLTTLGSPEVSGVAGSRTVGAAVLFGALNSLRLALLGLLLGAVVGGVLALLMQRLRLLEAGLLPWVVLSQTVPIIALAPLVAGWGGVLRVGSWAWSPEASVVVISAFLSFSPIAVGLLRGLHAPGATEQELFASCAASWRQELVHLRLPAAVPFLLPALRLAAAGAVVGAIVAEISTGTRGGIGRLIIEYAQQATSSPARVYAAVLGAAVLGLVAAGLVALLDAAVLRRGRLA
ncbi:NitT/TauT family transport system permease protein [Quadrisphaera granulorum]|uniref:NitT/TauT family transport system permease protein n=1 Tax=Quadrisphaera granulorum TaxID=317664 RepID=A0A316A7U2_9ACTN|nr:ABC transporter permease subunit [Quadrisphaera granulorum]PWJ52884.1 NitT/TauT family transport system permease protein [Quadrisphaera granulorum]SZE97266.1 NitT/TauT family transport system permease protein [Quadrisphaera granulorum]